MSQITKYSTNDAVKLDKEIRQLADVFKDLSIKTGIALAERIKVVRDNKLYKKLDEESYPNFYTYVESLGSKYSTVMEFIGLYETYVLAGGYTVEELAKIPYHALTVWKKNLFDKKEGKYELIKSKKELSQAVKSAEHLTIEDNRQLRREKEAGEHEHQMERIVYEKCKICGLREYKGR